MDGGPLCAWQEHQSEQEIKIFGNVVTLTFGLAFFYVSFARQKTLGVKEVMFGVKEVMFGDKVTFYGVMKSTTFAAVFKESA